METTKTPSVRAEIIDPSIENALPENCNMSILLQEDGLVFCILRNDVKKYIVLGDYTLEKNTTDFAALFSFKDQLEGVFAHYQIGYYTPNFSIIPAPLFNPNRIEEYANFQFEKGEEHILLFDELKTSGLVLIYSAPKALLQTVQNSFPEVKIKHAGFFTISHYHNLYKNKPGQHLHLQIWNGHLEVIAIENGKVLLLSSFAFQTDEDMLYFTLNVYEQLGLNPESVPLKISGEMEKSSSIWGLLLTYIRFVELEERPATAQYSHEFKSVPAHLYNRVFQAATCV